MSDLVSILIPAYNAERYVGAAVESALGQTYPAVEVIVVNDGSSDGTLAVARSYEDRGVRVVDQPNAGASAARNHALRLSAGAYLQYLDADDLLSPDKIEHQVRRLAESPPGCVAVSATLNFQDGAGPNERHLVPGYPALNSDDPLQWLLDLWTPGPGYGPARWGMIQPGAWLTPRAVADAAGPWDETISVDDDGEYFARILLASTGIRLSEQGHACYRQYPEGGSLSSQRSRPSVEGWIRSLGSKARHVLPRTTPGNREQAKVALARQYMDLAFHAYPEYPDLARAAEARADALGGHRSEAFDHSASGRRIARALGWRAAVRISQALHTLRR